ncbi:class I SAM-dependent methyltransferase [Candidatus Uhrbacteria bacterium]|nr:class I SAM-dependent methyltransferase [Candidatus Uhrbacteria bacterium]
MPAHILVVGCGTGRTVFPFGELGYTVSACDISPEMIRAAESQKALLKSSVNFYTLDAAFLDQTYLPDTFDVIWFPFHRINFIFPIQHRILYIKACQKIEKSTGTVIYNMHNFLFPRVLKQWLIQKNPHYTCIHSTEKSLWTYTRVPFLEKLFAQKYYQSVLMFTRYSLIPININMKWKERFARITAVIFDKSFYYILRKPKNSPPSQICFKNCFICRSGF